MKRIIQKNERDFQLKDSKLSEVGYLKFITLQSEVCPWGNNLLYDIKDNALFLVASPQDSIMLCVIYA